MMNYSVIDWYHNVRRRPQTIISGRRILFWMNKNEIEYEYILLYSKERFLFSLRMKDVVVNSTEDRTWSEARVEIPLHILLDGGQNAGDDFEVDIYLGESSFRVISCAVAVPSALSIDYLQDLSEATSDNGWAVSYVFIEDGFATVGGWAVLGGRGAPIGVKIGGRPADVRLVKNLSASERFWFLPETKWFGFEASAQVEEGAEWLKIELLSDAAPVGSPLPIYQRAKDRSALGPLPPAANIRRVSGAAANENTYINGGYTEFSAIRAIFSRHGVDLDNPEIRMLDWGCGCARITRHLLALEAGPARVVGIDIDQDNVNWCKKNLGADNFHLVGLRPPTSFGTGVFDVAFAVSVLSHLRESDADAWLAELARIVKPGGVVILSYNGPHSAAIYLSQFPDHYEVIREKGFLDYKRSDNLDGFIKDEDYYRFVFYADGAARDLCAKHFDVLGEEKACVAGGQDAIVLRRRADGAGRPSQPAARAAAKPKGRRA